MKALKLTLLVLVTTAATAQKKTIQDIAGQISAERLRANLYHLASEQMEGRAMGSHGDTLASEYIAASFKDSKLVAPYSNSYYQAINVLRKSLDAAKLGIGGQEIPYNNGWTIPVRSAENAQYASLPVVFAGYGIENSAYNDLAGIDVKGKAVLVLQGQPRDASGLYLLSGSNRPNLAVASYATTLKEKGAAVILVYNSRFIPDRQAPQPVYRSPYTAAPPSSVPSVSISETLANQLLAPSNKTVKGLEQEITASKQPQSFTINNSVAVDIRVSEKTEYAPNVIGYIQGTDPDAGHIIVSAHHDHVGRQNGRDIWYGAVDNASGTVALMEIATLMNEAAKNGLKPKRTIIFASYTGEERGLLGSFHLANNPLLPLAQAWGVLNIDMMGRVDTFYSGRRADSSYAYILVKDSVNHGLRNALLDANNALGKLKLDTHYEQPQFAQRRITGSDQYPFYAKGVPFIRIDCGFSKDYHQNTDTPDKINYELLTNQAQLAFLTTWNMANN